MRAVAFLAVGLSVVLLAGSAVFGLTNRHQEQSRTDQRLSTSAGVEAVQVEEYFARARSIILLTAHNPAYRAFYRDPGTRLDKIRARTRGIRDSEAGLAYIEQLYTTSISEVCFIDRAGPENARFVAGVRAPLGDLSPDESKNPFFAPTFALSPGQVYQAKPYVSPDTKTWVISNSTPLPGTGRPARAVIHFEVSVASFQEKAASIARGFDVAIIDTATGEVLVDSQNPQQVGAPLGQPRDDRFTQIAAAGVAGGTAMISGHRAAFRRLDQASHNANDWTVVVVDQAAAPSFWSSAGWAPLAMALTGLALLLVGAFGFRSSRRSLVERDRSRVAEQRRVDAERDYHETQREFTEVMQITRDEEEAYGLLKRHLERSLEGGDVLVLNRNNSHDRLEPMTELPAESVLHDALQNATPESCLAVRLGNMHERGSGLEPLLTCEICGREEGNSTCIPSLVGGEVIGSVLVRHPDTLAELGRRRIDESMTQASPVLANLRNLALSQARALTDGLTGLPNRRSIEDTLKRMVAQADRACGPLGVVLFDLDHFKQVNDLFGHEKGDEVLSAVGAAVLGTLRSSDFAGRHGGEEFILLLPETDAASAVVVAEKVRVALAAIEVPDVPRAITASFGVAAMPGDGSEPSSLLRTADRALYLAKAGGRNRVETLAVETLITEELPPSTRVNGHHKID
jgi:diguanylate cyclase (GGDEF)-like protein